MVNEKTAFKILIRYISFHTVLSQIECQVGNKELARMDNQACWETQPLD